jgi:DNA-binding SARP family transcriptional activator/tetratricopeptide (TPR) repeat protein
MAHLSLSLLGPFQVTLDEEPVTSFESSKVRALLAYLAVEAHRYPEGHLRPHRREALAGLLWPNRPDRAALANLRNALANLRTAIGDRDATPPFLLITRQTIQFNAASDHWLDVAAFRTLVETTEADHRVNHRLEEAVVLYRGDLLEGFSVRGSPDFENWSLLTRERLQREALVALCQLVAHYEGSGEVGRACEVAWRQVELAPWEEEAHQQLMRLLALSGRRAAALAQYEACRQVLAEELGVAPGAETTALYERIRDGEVAEAEGQGAALVLPMSQKRGEDLGPVALPPFLTGTASDDRPTLHFVARERELAQLDGYLAEALAGQGRTVFVTGEAGTGKTALVQAFARRAQARHTDLVVAGGNCSAYTGLGDPYLPFREILGDLTGDVESRWASGAVSTEGARRLWDLIPRAVQALLEAGPSLIDTLLDGRALAARAAAAVPAGAPWRDGLEKLLSSAGPGGWRADPSRADLYVQVTAFLSALARQRPLLMTVDDLHWADVGSIDLLFHLGRRLSGSSILVIGAYRPSEVALGRDGGRHPLAQVLHELQRQHGPIEVGLPQAGDRQFVNAFLDSEPNHLGHGFREALYAHTRGHALCTVEMLRELQERGDLVQDEAGRWVEGPAVDWASLPERVRGVVGERIDRLPAALRETLRVASVEGEAFTAEVVALVRGSPASEVVGRLADDLDRRHRLVANEGSQRAIPGGQRTSRYRFRHILFQEYVYGGLDEAERAYLHEAVGDALEQLHAGQAGAAAVQLARHYHAAARMDKAADYALQAGDRARRLYAHAEACQLYAQAWDALAELPDTEGNRRRRVEALIAQTPCSWGTDSTDQCLARLAEAKRLALHLPGPDGKLGGDRLLLARVRFWMGRVHYMHGAIGEATEHYRQVLSLAGELGDTGLIANSSSAMGAAMTIQGRQGEAAALLGQAIPLFERLGDGAAWCRALSNHGGALAMMGHYAEGLAEIERARAWAEEMGVLQELVHNDYHLNVACMNGGDLPRAREAACQAVTLAEQSGDRVGVYVGRFHQSWTAARSGQYEIAAAYAAEAQAMAAEAGDRLIHADHLTAFHAEIALGLGHVQKAIDLAERAVGIAQETGGIFAEGLAHRTWGQALAALVPPVLPQGRRDDVSEAKGQQWDEAEAHMAQSLRRLEEGQARLEAARTQVAWGTICRDRGDLTAAQAHWERAAAQWETSSLTHELERTRALMERLPIAL